MCKRKKKAMSPRHSTYIPSSVKWPFWDLEDDIGLGGGGDFILIIWGATHNGMGLFLWGSWPLETPCKDFSLAIGGELGWKKWLKNGAGKDLYFMQLFLQYTLFGENFIP